MPEKNTNEELSTEKVAEALNASTEAKKASEETVKSIKETNEVLKSVASALEKVTKIAEKSEENKISDESFKELKSQLALVKAKQESFSAGHVSGSSFKNEAFEVKTKEALKSFASAVIGKSMVKLEEKSNVYGDCGVLEQKSLITSDNSGVGAFVPARKILGEININLQTVNPVTSIVNNVNAGAIVAQELGYKTFDPSYVEIYESGEAEGKSETPRTQMGDVVIHVMQNSAKVKISDKTLHSAESGELSTNPLLREFAQIERFYEKKIARQILNGTIGMGINGILPQSQISGFKGEVVASINDNYVVLEDLGRLASNLKSDYIRNAVILIDRAALYDLFYDEANDGHLRIEQFDYASGIASLRTPEGTIPLIGVNSSSLAANIKQNDGFANYKSFASSSIIDSGYTPRFGALTGSTDNAGKAVAVLADFNMGYSLARSSVAQVGYDNSFGNLLSNGYVWGGKIGYVGGKVTCEEAIVVLTVL